MFVKVERFHSVDVFTSLILVLVLARRAFSLLLSLFGIIHATATKESSRLLLAK